MLRGPPPAPILRAKGTPPAPILRAKGTPLQVVRQIVKEQVVGATTTVDKSPDQENQEGGCLRGKEGNCGPVGAACTNERLCNDLASDGFFKGPGVAKRYCTTNSIGDSFLQRRPGTVPFPPAYGPLALELGHWDGGSQRRCKWPLCGLRFAVSYASTGETSRLDSPMLPRQDPKGTDALWGSMQVRLERSLVEWGARRPGTSLRTEIRSRIPTPTRL